MGDAMTLPSPSTALSVENKGRTHRFALCRRVYSIITWHSSRRFLFFRCAALPMCLKARGTVSLLVCNLISVSAIDLEKKIL